MKRLTAFMLIVFLLVPWYSLSEEYICPICEFGVEACGCYLQMGDQGPAVEGVIALLKEKGFLSGKHSKGVFDEECRQAVMAFQKSIGAFETGMLDHVSLTHLIWGDEMAGLYIDGEIPEMDLIPVNGGEKRHAIYTCSGMISPRLVAVYNAEFFGMEPCGKCNRE